MTMILTLATVGIALALIVFEYYKYVNKPGQAKRKVVRKTILTTLMLMLAILSLGYLNSYITDAYFSSQNAEQKKLASIRPEKNGEFLIIVFPFSSSKDVPDSKAHERIALSLRGIADDLSLTKVRIEVANRVYVSVSDIKGARRLGQHLNASVVIWGSEGTIELLVQFINLKNTRMFGSTAISEGLVEPKANFSEFVRKDLPRRIDFFSLLAISEALYAKRSYAQSEQAVIKALLLMKDQKIKPASSDAYALAEAYFRLGWLMDRNRSRYALTAYNRALDLKPDSPDTLNNRAAIYMSQVKNRTNSDTKNEQLLKKAMLDLNRAIKLSPDYYRLYGNKGSVYAMQGNFEGGLENYKKAIALKPNYALAHHGLAAIYYQTSSIPDDANLKIAKLHSDTAIDLGARLAETYYVRACINSDLHNEAEASSDYRNALRLGLDPDAVDLEPRAGISSLKRGSSLKKP